MVPLYFLEDDITWVVSKLYGAAGSIWGEATELKHWLLQFGWASEELGIIFTELVDWIANSSPPLSAYRALMEFWLAALDKVPGVLPFDIGETLLRDLEKLFLQAAGDQRANRQRLPVETLNYVPFCRQELRGIHMRCGADGMGGRRIRTTWWRCSRKEQPKVGGRHC